MIASQLGCPEGEQGIKLAENMAISNAYMTESSIKDFMETLPFTTYGFTLYDENTVKQLLLIAGFNIIYVETQLEKIPVTAGKKWSGLFIMCLRKSNMISVLSLVKPFLGAA